MRSSFLAAAFLTDGSIRKPGNGSTFIRPIGRNGPRKGHGHHREARPNCQAHFAAVFRELDQLHDFPLFEGNPPIHAGGKLGIVGCDKRGQL